MIPQKCSYFVTSFIVIFCLCSLLLSFISNEKNAMRHKLGKCRENKFKPIIIYMSRKKPLHIIGAVRGNRKE